MLSPEGGSTPKAASRADSNAADVALKARQSPLLEKLIFLAESSRSKQLSAVALRTRGAAQGPDVLVTIHLLISRSLRLACSRCAGGTTLLPASWVTAPLDEY